MAAAAPELGVLMVKLGSQGLHVSKPGLGCAAMCGYYGPMKHDDEIILLIRHSVSRGVTFLETADVYGPFTNEILVGKALPRFQAKNLEKNKVIYENLSRIASKKGCLPAQLALARLYSQGDVVPIPGTSQFKNLENNICALSVNLTSEDKQEVESNVLSVVSGESYPETWKHCM